MHFVEGDLAGVDGECHAHRTRKFETFWIDVRHHNMARTRMTHNRGGHESDRTCSGDEHVLAEHREAERSVCRVAEGIEDRGHIEVDALMVRPHIRHRQRDVLGKCSCAVDANSRGMRA